jgi:hypothetical protein
MESDLAQLAGVSIGYVPAMGFGPPGPGGPPRPGAPGAEPPPPQLQAKMQELQKGLRRWRDQQRDLSPIGQSMGNSIG